MQFCSDFGKICIFVIPDTCVIISNSNFNFFEIFEIFKLSTAHELFENVQNFKKVDISIGYDHTSIWDHKNVNFINVRAKLDFL